MAYERYIKRGNKLYGPYIYHNNKKDGKVVSKYLGKKYSGVTEKVSNSNEEVNKKTFQKKYLLLGFLGFIVVLFAFFLINFNLTGNVSLSIDDVYFAQENITGSVKLFLEQGELIPGATNVIFQINDYSYNYFLNDLVSDELTEGDFYINGKNISGRGLGYGAGAEPVTFSLGIYSNNKTVEKSKEVGGKIIGGKEVVEEELNETEEGIIENETEEFSPEEEIVKEQENIDEVVESEIIEGSEGDVVEEKEEKEVKSAPLGGYPEGHKPQGGASTSSRPQITEYGGKVVEDASITGNIISRLFGNVFNFFLRFTGQVSLELEEEIQGEVSVDNPFVYDLTEGQTAEIISSSQDVDFKIKNNQVIVSVKPKDIKKEIVIKLDDLNIPVHDGKFVVSLVYDGVEIISVSETIHVKENKTEIIEENITIFNETVMNGNISVVINTTQYGAVLNQPVKWKKQVNADEIGKIRVRIPKQAENVTVYKIVKEKKSDFVEGVKEVEAPEIIINETAVENVSEVIDENKTAPLGGYPEGHKPQSSEYGGKKINTTFVDEDLVNKTQKVKKEKITANVISGKISAEIDFEKSSVGGFFKKIFGFITGRVVDVEETEEIKEVVIEENATEFEIEYETPGPVAFEEDTSYGKEILISSDVHYENILVYTELPSVMDEDDVKLYNIVNGTRVEVEFQGYYLGNQSGSEEHKIAQAEFPNTTGEAIYSQEDLNESDLIIENSSVENNSIDAEQNYSESFINNQSSKDKLINYIEWVVPSLSNQSYELVIVIIKAEHLDENRSFISDIYDEVKAKDDNWSEVISDGEYVRITFEKDLDSTRDITFYAREFCNETILINGTEIPCNIYQKKKRIDELRGVLR